MIHLYLSKLEMLAFTADLHALAGCISCLFSTGPYVASYALGVCLLSRAHPIMLGLSWSLYDLCLLDRMLPCLATGHVVLVFLFLVFLFVVCQCLFELIAKYMWRVLGGSNQHCRFRRPK